MPPVTRITDLTVVISQTVDGPRIEVIDTRMAAEILSLQPAAAAALAGVIAGKYAELVAANPDATLAPVCRVCGERPVGDDGLCDECGEAALVESLASEPGDPGMLDASLASARHAGFRV